MKTKPAERWTNHIDHKEHIEENDGVRGAAANESTIRSFLHCLALCSLCSLWLLLLLAPRSNAHADAPKAERFIACPVYRDTDAGRKSGCWLATNNSTGVQYDVADALIKPILGREILVEGVVTNRDPGMCGAPILEPISVSVLDTECKAHLIPAENFPGRKFALPAKTLQPTWIERKAPPPPYTTREYPIYFELNSEFLLYQHSEVIIDEALTYIRASKPKKVVVIAYADTEGFTVSGRHLHEDVALAKSRANMVREALVRMGVAKSQIETQWKGEPALDAWADTGLVQASKRRAVIRVEL
jgi:outer membrane protein OmpA-like peptidoglycan-associated protein